MLLFVFFNLFYASFLLKARMDTMVKGKVHNVAEDLPCVLKTTPERRIIEIKVKKKKKKKKKPTKKETEKQYPPSIQIYLNTGCGL